MINKEFNFMLYVTIIIDTDKKVGMSSAFTWTPHRKNRCRSMCDCIYMYLASLATRICRYNSNRYVRSEEHTSELQSRFDLVCRLLLEKKKKTTSINQS